LKSLSGSTFFFIFCIIFIILSFNISF
jgi:hypothetical protein